ncbi:trypsin-like peptidase domain-containing protein [Paenibacillus sp. TRM 82003]|nr:trypsin-like peptidase domain-containing protein [Paenibacillus sp. TRM 82003]
MSLFDDDFYSPKVSPWERKRLSATDDRWPSRHWLSRFSGRSGRWVGAGAVALALGVGAFALPLLGGWWFAGGDERVTADRGNEAGGAAPGGGQPINVVDVVAETKPAIVSVINLQKFAIDGESPIEQETGIGSGIIYWKEGNKARLVTNQHVVEGATAIQVVLYDGKRMNAQLIGGDALTDLAVLEIDAGEVDAVVSFGNSDVLQEGEPVIALGHPFGLGYSPSVTSGIISSLHRVIPISLASDGQIDWEMELLQTDAAINHGNSGGALLNLDGEVIGINSMKVSQSGVEGLGFAIPSNAAGPVIAELEEYGKVRRPYLGVATVDLNQYRFTADAEDTLELPTEVKEGIIVLEAYDPAAGAGIGTNDVIVALDGKAIDSTLALRKYLYANKKIGDPIRVDFYRGGEKESVTLKLSETPEP